MADARVVPAVTFFAGEPGREREAAEAWAFELKYYFRRRVGEQPRVEYEDGIYTCTGLMTTTHPGDTGTPVVFDYLSEPWDLEFSVDPYRRARLRLAYDDGCRWDGTG
jgi:hypothetical protein